MVICSHLSPDESVVEGGYKSGHNLIHSPALRGVLRLTVARPSAVNKWLLRRPDLALRLRLRKGGNMGRVSSACFTIGQLPYGGVMNAFSWDRALLSLSIGVKHRTV